MENTARESKKRSKATAALTVIGVVFCIILILFLIVNCTLLVKSLVTPNEVPDFFGVLPMIILNDSMHPDIQNGDLIICTVIDAEDVQKGNVISFYDPDGNDVSVVTHKVVEVIEENGTRSFRTAGIHNANEDSTLVPAKNVVAKYTGIRFAGMGNVVIFLQSTPGLIFCILLPFVLFFGYDIATRKKSNKKGFDVPTPKAEAKALPAEPCLAKPEQESPKQTIEAYLLKRIVTTNEKEQLDKS